MKALDEWRHTAIILNYDIKYEVCGWIDAPAAFTPGKEPPLSTEQEAWGVPGRV
jgi:hypothetical protein